MLLWKTNFDINSPSVDSTNKKYPNSTDYRPTSRISSMNLQENKSPITSLEEKSQPKTSDERRARKVIVKKPVYHFLRKAMI